MSKLPVNFTKAFLDSLPNIQDSNRYNYRDAQVSGLSLRHSKGAKSFYVLKKINSKTERIYLGKYPDLSVENARKIARVKIGQIAMGENPLIEKRRLKMEMTLGQLFDQYMKRYSKIHKKSWKYDQAEIPRFFSKWFPRRLSDIHRTDIKRLHETLYIESGLYQANRCLERIRAMYNKAIEWGWEGKNPTTGIKKYREKSRDRFIQPYEMPYIIEAIKAEPNHTARDLFWLLLMTGTRKTNTLMMRWEEINWQASEWKIPDTKNGDSLVVALSERAIVILKERYKNTKSHWVFPQDDDNEKHFINLKRAWKRIKEIATINFWLTDERISQWMQEVVNELPNYYNCGTGYNTILRRAKKDETILPPSMVDIRLHDIRRTFGSYQALTGASLQIIGKSLGHKSLQSTQVYARLNLDPIRASIEKASDAMFK